MAVGSLKTFGYEPIEELPEILPFHQLGRHKWQELGYAYPLEATPSATPEQIAPVREAHTAVKVPEAVGFRLFCKVIVGEQAPQAAASRCRRTPSRCTGGCPRH